MTAPSAWIRGRRPRPRRTSLRVEQLETRLVPYALSGNAWPSPQLITLSFEPDGTVLGSNGTGPVTSNLFSAWNAHFGSAAAWQKQVLLAAQAWAQQTNINFAVVSDDGSAIGSGGYQQGDPAKGDIRVGGDNFGTGTLAQAEMPPPINNYSAAGDVQFNTGQPFNLGTTYDLYSVALHEIGHALGLYHSGSSAAVMYGTYMGTKYGLNADDIAGIRAIYSLGLGRSPDLYDAVLSNNTFTTATTLTALISPLSLTSVVTGLDITTTSDVDYYTFLAPLGTSGSLTLTVQSQGLSLLAPKAWVYGSDQTTVLGYASGAGQYGTTLTLTIPNVTAGQLLYLKVAGAEASALGTGAYAVTLNFGTGPSPTVPLPNTTLANGSPLSAGGGQAEMPPPGTDGPGRDLFPDPDSVTPAPRAAAAPVAPAVAAAVVAAVPATMPASQVHAAARPAVAASVPAPVAEGTAAPTRVMPVAAGGSAAVPSNSGVSSPAVTPQLRSSRVAEDGGGSVVDSSAEAVAAAAVRPAADQATPAGPDTPAPPTTPAAAPTEPPAATALPTRGASGEAPAAVPETRRGAARFSLAAVAGNLAFLFAWTREPEKLSERRRAG